MSPAGSGRSARWAAEAADSFFPRSRSRLFFLFSCLLPALLGCASADKPPAAPGALVSLWSAHGGPGSWKRHEAASFSYRAVLGRSGVRLEIPRVAIRLRDPGRLWVRAEPDAAPELVDLRGPPGSVLDALSRFLESSRDVSREDGEDLELAVRALPYLFGIPLAASSGPWEFRTLAAPSDIPVPGDIEVAPLGQAPIGGCVLFANGSTGLLAKAVYARRFPVPRKEPRVVSFERPVRVGDVTLFSRRIHEESRKPEPERVLFSSAREAAPREPWTLEEDLSGIALIEGKEAVAVECPPPPESPGAVP